MQYPANRPRRVLFYHCVNQDLAYIAYSRHRLQNHGALWKARSFEPVNLGSVQGESSFLGVGSDLTHLSLPASCLFLLLDPWGSSGENFSEAADSIFPPQDLHFSPRPNSLHSMHLWSLVLAMSDTRPTDSVHELYSFRKAFRAFLWIWNPRLNLFFLKQPPERLPIRILQTGNLGPECLLCNLEPHHSGR